MRTPSDAPPFAISDTWNFRPSIEPSQPAGAPLDADDGPRQPAEVGDVEQGQQFVTFAIDIANPFGAVRRQW
jgi:hypothetical protein